MAMSNFRDFDRRTAFLLPPSVDEWLPERHLARFVVEVIDGLDLGGMIGAYRGSGSAAHNPRMLLGVLVYGYATGVFSSRKLERATYDSVAFRYIAANDHPDHDTIATFRRRFLKEIEGLFVQVLLLAREMGVLKNRTLGLDGTKIHANASRHSALSWEHASKLEAQLKAEVADLLARAEAEDRQDRQSALSERHAAGRRARAAIRRTRRWRAVGGGRAKGGGDCLPQRLIGGQGVSRLARQDNRRGEARSLYRDRRRLPRPSESRRRSVRAPRQGLRHRDALGPRRPRGRQPATRHADRNRARF